MPPASCLQGISVGEPATASFPSPTASISPSRRACLEGLGSAVRMATALSSPGLNHGSSDSEAIRQSPLSWAVEGSLLPVCDPQQHTQQPQEEKMLQTLTTAQAMVHNGKDAAEIPVLFLPADNIAHGAVQQVFLIHHTVPHLEVIQAADEAVAYPHNKAILSFVQMTQHQATVGFQALSAANGFGMHELTIAVDLQQLSPGVPQAADAIPHKKGQIDLNVSSGAKKIQSQVFVFSRESKL